jgi:transcriptional regulator with XRE-family HTH domain
MKSGLTVNGLANKAGVSQSYLRDIELGNKQPTIEYLEYICEALKISLVDFFDVSNSTYRFTKAISHLTEAQKNKLTAFIEEMF